MILPETRLIGNTLTEAIDWTQALLGCHRPHASALVEVMIKDGGIIKTSYGMIAIDTDEEIHKRRFAFMNQARQRFGKPAYRYLYKPMQGCSAALDMMIASYAFPSEEET